MRAWQSTARRPSRTIAGCCLPAGFRLALVLLPILGGWALPAGALADAAELRMTLSAPIAPDSLLWRGAMVERVEVEGRSALSSLEIERALAVTADRAWTGRTLADLLERLLGAYRAAGYLEVRVLAVHARGDAEAVRVTFEIDEGTALPLRVLEIRGATLLSEAEVRERLDLRIGEPFDLARFEQGVERVLDVYENAGRPFARLEPVAVRWEEDGLHLVLRVTEGTMIELGRTEIRGNDVTQARVIERLAGIRYGVPFAQRDLERARERLQRSGLFQSVAPIRLAQDADRSRGVLLIDVKEGRPNRVAGVLGYSGEEQGLTGLFELELGNIAGTARRAFVRWEGRGQGVNLFRFNYAEPWIFGSPVSLELGLGRTVQDTFYTLSDLRLLGNVDLTPDWRLNLGWERESSILSVGDVRGTARDALVLGSDFDSRDSRVNPRQGWLIHARFRLARKRLSYRAAAHIEDQRVGVQTGELLIERAQPWARRHVSLIRGTARVIESDERPIPYYELFPLGGATSLRGYREEQFRGSRIGLLTLEQRIVLDAGGSRVFGFADLGYVSTRGTALAPELGGEQTLKLGYGVGLRLATRLGLVGVDYGLGEGDGPLDGKVHFLLESSF